MGAGRWADACRTTAQSTGGWPAVQLNNVCVCVSAGTPVPRNIAGLKIAPGEL